MKIDIKTTLSELHPVLEEYKLVGKRNGKTPNLKNLSFNMIKKCCTLTNDSRISLLFHRILAWLWTGEVMSNSQIGKNLFYDYLWINSIVAKEILEGNHPQKESLLKQILLIEKIFDEIVLAKYNPNPKPKIKTSHDSAISNHVDINQHNHAISKMFQIEKNNRVGACLAEDISKSIKCIKEIYTSSNPKEQLFQTIYHSILAQDLVVSKGIRGIAKQTFITSFSPKYVSVQIPKSSEPIKEQKKILPLLYQQPITLKTINQKYQKGKIAPFKIKLLLE